MFKRIKPTAAEIAAALPGDAIIPRADVVMDRAFTLDCTPEQLWPWLVQLGKERSGWYFPRWVEWFIPRSRRALRYIEPKLQAMKVGDVIPDWGGKDATFSVAMMNGPTTIVHTSTRGQTSMSWAIVARPDGNCTRLQFRLRLRPVKFAWLARSFGGFFDAVTIAGLEAGLRERVHH